MGAFTGSPLEQRVAAADLIEAIHRRAETHADYCRCRICRAAGGDDLAFSELLVGMRRREAAGVSFFADGGNHLLASGA